MNDLAKIYGAFSLVALALFAAMVFFVGPPPPTHIRLATGIAGGAYAAAGEQIAAILQRAGVGVEIVATNGSQENVRRLQANGADAVDAAIVQGGVTPNLHGERIASLGGLFLEPVWLFARNLPPGLDVQRLTARKVAVGPDGSGSRLLALTLLADNGVSASDLELSPLGGEAAVDALRTGQVDAAFLVGGVNSSWVRALFQTPGVTPITFDRAPAYARRHPFLVASTLDEGALDLRANLPSAALPIVAPTAQLVVRATTHSAIQGLLIDACREVFSHGDSISAPGAFPDPHLVQIPLSPEARHYYDQGPSFIRRSLPYWAANLVERVLIFLVPAATLLFPLAQALPRLYDWRTRSRIYRWYRNLRSLEERGVAAQTADERQAVGEQLQTLLLDVRRVKVPLSYTDALYGLRMHINLVREILDQRAKAQSHLAGASTPSDG